ncbi:PH domain-containing protein [Paramyrothecium foliicola]|nr:PH domain-containing protein [Paramyrothecium foliicola]
MGLAEALHLYLPNTPFDKEPFVWSRLSSSNTTAPKNGAQNCDELQVRSRSARDEAGTPRDKHKHSVSHPYAPKRFDYRRPLGSSDTAVDRIRPRAKPLRIKRAPMDPRVDSGEDEPSPPAASPPPPRRRHSMDEDLFYHQVMTATPRRPSNPPSYDTTVSPRRTNRQHIRRAMEDRDDSAPGSRPAERLPDYSNSIALEGVFTMKHEIENTTKRAEDRHWHTVVVSLNGTALNVHKVKKDWGWGKSRDGPSISPDNPPWVKKGKLERSYSLLYADAGIAADYKKRRYVIRIRAETDQFLLSCVELSTFVKWLESLFAAIDIAAPIDDRDFPRDMSIPRIQRIRWFRGQSPTRTPQDSSPSVAENVQEQPQEDAEAEPVRLVRRRSSSPELSSIPALERRASRDTLLGPVENGEGGDEEQETAEVAAPPDDDPSTLPLRREHLHRFSTTSYPNLAVDPHTGKWFPEHGWTTAHDMLYAKLCYSNLFFRSPRKSNYIISKGKQWYVDWATGRMVRVLPPAYGEVDYFGAWQVVHTENPRI